MSLFAGQHNFRFQSASSDMRMYGASFLEPRIEVSLILEGEVTFIVDGKERIVAAPAASFQAYRKSLKVVTPRERYTRTMWCYTSSQVLDDFEWALAQRLPPSIAISGALHTLFDSAFSIPDDAGATPTGASPNMDEHIRNALGAAIFAEYLRCANNASGQAQSMPASVQRARAAISEHYLRPWEVRDLAEIAGVTSNYLIHLFKKHLGQSPIRYLWSRRVETGVHLLRTTDLSVEEIAFRSGFQSGAHFSRLIKRETGSSPGKLRHVSPGLTSWAKRK